MAIAFAPNERKREKNICSNVRVILRPSATAEDAQMLHRRKESELSLSACRLCADGQPRSGYPSQNDVKFKRTNAVKVLVKLFQKLVGCGATPHISHRQIKI